MLRLTIPEFQSVTKQILELSQSKKVELIVMGTRGRWFQETLTWKLRERL